MKTNTQNTNEENTHVAINADYKIVAIGNEDLMRRFCNTYNLKAGLPMNGLDDNGELDDKAVSVELADEVVLNNVECGRTSAEENFVEEIFA